MSESINNLMSLQQNERRSHYLSYLTAGRWAWVDMLKNTIWAVRQVYVDIDPETKTLNIPNDIARLINISIVNSCGEIKPLAYNPTINTVPLQMPGSCSCKKCAGQNSLCGLLDYVTMRTEDVTINGDPFVKRTYNKRVGNSIYEITETPRADDSGDAVYYEDKRLLCVVTLNADGCIAKTEENTNSIMEHCGCFIPACHKQICDRRHPASRLTEIYVEDGSWKEDALNGSLIHLKSVDNCRAIITYQSMGGAGITGGEILIPEYAAMAFMYGVEHYSTSFNKGATLAEKRAAKGSYYEAKMELRKFMNPVRISEFMALQQLIPKW